MVLSGNQRVVGAKPCRTLGTVSGMPLKGTGEARGKPPRGRTWLRDRMVSAHEVDFNLRGIRPWLKTLAEISHLAGDYRYGHGRIRKV